MADSFTEAEMELSKTKSVCTASTEALVRKLEELLKDLCVTFETQLNPLGSAWELELKSWQQEYRALRQEYTDFE